MPAVGGAIRTRVLAASLALVLGSSLAFVTNVAAVTATVTPATGGGAISADLTGTASYAPLTGPAITENAAGVLASGGTIVLTVPAGFVFKAGSGSVTKSGAMCDIATSGVTTTTTTATVTVTTASTVSTCVLTFSGLLVQPTLGTPLASGDITNTGTTGPGGATNYGTLTEVAGAPATISFATQPSSSTGGVAFPTQPKVHVVDQFGNVATGRSVVLTITPGTGSASGVLTCTANPVSTDGGGDAQFAGCKINVAANNYKLRASAAPVSVDSNAFNITVGPKDHLVFTSWPATNTQTLFSPQPVVAIVDLGGNTVTSATDTVTLTANQNDGTFTCTGGKSKPAVAGVASFSGCTETVVANNYTLTASATGLTAAISPLFNVTSGAASKLQICWGPALPCNVTPPATIQGGTAFTTQPVVRVQDAAGNTVVTDSTTAVSLAILPGTPTSGGPGTLTCNANSVTVVNGVGTFAGCRIDTVGTAYRLNAAAIGLTSGQSAPFNVVPGPPVGLKFLVQPPATATATVPFPSNVQVAIVDAGGNTVTSGIVATIQLAIGANPASGTLTCSGGASVVTTSGVATFTNCAINNQGTGYTLLATATASTPVTALGTVTSNVFNVLAAPAGIALIPSSNVITWGGTVVFSIQFASNGAGKQFSLQVSRDQLTWSTIAGATLTADASGHATFSYRPSDNRYYRVSFAGTPDLSAAFSPIQRVVVRQISLLRPTHTGYQSINPGTQIQFSATVRPNRPELPQPVVDFVVYQFVGGHWTKVLDRMVNTDRNPSSANYGKAAIFITFNTPGRFYVRSQAVPTPLNANSGWSNVVLYLVR